jgi:hypothetical protein
VPNEEALVHEFYTPTLLCQEVARLLRPWVDGLPLHNKTVLALEPSAGIGRFINALSVPGFELLKWTAIEYSRPSAAILQRFRPDINLVSSSFEEWVASFGGRLRGKVGLIVGNPPYGQRGPEITVDPDKRFRDDKAYVYFLRRNLDLLAEGGVLAMIVPYGLLTSRTTYFTNLRQELLTDHHLRLAYRLPSSMFPGAKIVTDLVVFESRGGSLSATLLEDNYIVAGEYFERHPSNILGVEVTDTDEKKAFRYEVTGTFVRLPDAESRPRCLVCSVTRHDLPPSQVAAKRLAHESLPVACPSRRDARYASGELSGSAGQRSPERHREGVPHAGWNSPSRSRAGCAQGTIPSETPKPGASTPRSRPSEQPTHRTAACRSH